jgi:hypothetical protein
LAQVSWWDVAWRVPGYMVTEAVDQIFVEPAKGVLSGDPVEIGMAVASVTPLGRLKSAKRVINGIDELSDTGKGAVRTLDKARDASKSAKKNGPDPNNGNAKPHGGPDHNDAIDQRIKDLQEDKSVDGIRKNQVQVNKDGNRVGNNRPDVQYDKDGVHHNVEYDTKHRSSDKHRETIEKNDPNAKNELNKVPCKK